MSNIKFTPKWKRWFTPKICSSFLWIFISLQYWENTRQCWSRKTRTKIWIYLENRITDRGLAKSWQLGHQKRNEDALPQATSRNGQQMTRVYEKTVEASWARFLISGFTGIHPIIVHIDCFWQKINRRLIIFQTHGTRNSSRISTFVPAKWTEIKYKWTE